MIRFVNKELMRIVISVLLYVLSFFLKKELSFILLIVTYILIGYETFLKVIKNISKGLIFEENFLMTIATIGAFIIGEYKEGVAVMLFYEIGEYINDLGVDKSKESIKSLVDLRSDRATLIENNKEKIVNPDRLKIDDIIIVKPGERIPIDGIVIDGTSSIDTSSITGESIPKDVKRSSIVYSGYINLNGILKIKVTTKFTESTASRILKIIEESDLNKSKTQQFINKFARKYTPFVVVSAFLIFLIPILFLNGNIHDWLYRSLVFLVASCPCALILSIPLGYFCGIGVASKQGILVKGSSDLEELSKIDTFVFDKTGTITKGIFEVKKINAINIKERDLLKIAAYGEYYSNHPIAISIKNYYGKSIDTKVITSFKEQDGGIKVKLGNDDILIGNYEFLVKNKVKIDKTNDVGTVVYIIKNKQYIGNIIIGDTIKDEATSFIEELKRMGINDIIVLSGDNELIVSDVCKKLKINQYEANLKPIDKRDIVKKLKQNHKVCFVGDGINDAIVLLESDLGISMGNIGSDAAIEASDIVIMNDDLLRIIKGINISKHTNVIVWENIIFALLMKTIVLGLGVFGISTILMAVFADIGVTIITILNSIRIFIKEKFVKK